MKRNEDAPPTKDDPSSTESTVEAYTQERSGKTSNTSDTEIQELTSSRNRAVQKMRKASKKSDF